MAKVCFDSRYKTCLVFLFCNRQANNRNRFCGICTRFSPCSRSPKLSGILANNNRRISTHPLQGCIISSRIIVSLNLDKRPIRLIDENANIFKCCWGGNNSSLGIIVGDTTDKIHKIELTLNDNGRHLFLFSCGFKCQYRTNIDI